VLEIRYSASTPQRAAQGADAVATEFIALNREHRDALVAATTEWLGKQTGELKARLGAASQALHTYAASSGIVFSGPEEQSTLAKERMRRIEDSLTAAQTERAARQARFETALAARPEALPEGALQTSYRESVTQLQNLRRELADLKTMFTPAHQKVKSLEAQIAELEQALARERTDAVARLRTDYLAAAGLEVRLAAAHAEQLKTLQSQAAMSTRYTLLKREVETMQQVYDAMLQREKEASMAAALRATNVRIIDTAQPPTSPRSPSLPLHVALGLAVGCFAGLALTVVRERADIMRQPGDAAGLFVPELGAIPSARLDRALNGASRWPLRLASRHQPLELVTWREEHSLLSESFRATLASILFRIENNGAPGDSASAAGRTFVFTSVEPVEGKTTVATNLAIALAETGKRVLLIDADLRRPRMHSIFELCNDWGLSDLLEGDGPAPDSPLDALARTTQIPNLWVLPSGPGTAVISRLLYSPALENLLAQLRRLFDLILVDSPPLAYYSDARVFGHTSDGVVLVVRANKTGRESLRAACLRLIEDGIPILGTVLNDFAFDDSRRRGYADYYRYKPV
jgi:capsular exopolysaccharide synthesis family protein